MKRGNVGGLGLLAGVAFFWWIIRSTGEDKGREGLAQLLDANRPR
jgi:hypothetical protein